MTRREFCGCIFPCPATVPVALRVVYDAPVPGQKEALFSGGLTEL